MSKQGEGPFRSRRILAWATEDMTILVNCGNGAHGALLENQYPMVDISVAYNEIFKESNQLIFHTGNSKHNRGRSALQGVQTCCSDYELTFRLDIEFTAS